MVEEIKNQESQTENPKSPIKFRFKKRILEVKISDIDYRNPDVLQRFISKTGKILPRRMTGASAKLQRKISREIKRARMANLLPFTKR